MKTFAQLNQELAEGKSPDQDPGHYIPLATRMNRAHNETRQWGLHNPVDTPEHFRGGVSHGKEGGFGWNATIGSARGALAAIHKHRRILARYNHPNEVPDEIKTHIDHAIHKGWASEVNRNQSQTPEKIKSRNRRIQLVQKHGYVEGCKHIDKEFGQTSGDEQAKDRELTMAALHHHFGTK